MFDWEHFFLLTPLSSQVNILLCLQNWWVSWRSSWKYKKIVAKKEASLNGSVCSAIKWVLRADWLLSRTIKHRATSKMESISLLPSISCRTFFVLYFLVFLKTLTSFIPILLWSWFSLLSLSLSLTLSLSLRRRHLRSKVECISRENSSRKMFFF